MAGVVARAVDDRERGLPAEMSLLWNGHRLALSPAASWRIAGQAKRRNGTHNAKRAAVERLIARHLHRQIGEDEDWPSSRRPCAGSARCARPWNACGRC